MKYRLCCFILIVLCTCLTSCTVTPYRADKSVLENINSLQKLGYGYTLIGRAGEEQAKKAFCEKYGHTPYLDSYDSLLTGHAYRCMDCKVICEIKPHSAQRTEVPENMVILNGTCYVQTIDYCECHLALHYRCEPFDLTGVPVTSSPAGMTLEEADVYFDEMEAEGFGEWVEYAKEVTE